LFAAIVNPYPCPRADVLVIGAFISILESSPAADVVDQNRLKVGCAGFHFQHERLQSITTIHSQTATAGILKNARDCKAALFGISADRLELIFGRVFLQVCRHPNVGYGEGWPICSV
jgi:hypothetical protein